MTIKSKYNLIFILIIILFFIIVYLCKINTNNQHNLIKINEVTRSIFYAPQYVAIELGYFEDEGINVELMTSNGSDQAMSSIISGSSDIALVGPETAVYIYQKGKKNYPVIFASLTKRDGHFLVGKEKKEDFNWENLNGKCVISNRKGSLPYMLFLYITYIKKIKPKIIDNISLDSAPTAYISGAGDYINLLEPSATSIKNKTNSNILKSLSSETKDIPYTVYSCTSEYFNSNKKTISKFVRAINKAQFWIEKNNSETIANSIKGHFPHDNLENITLFVEKYKENGVWNQEVEIGKKSIDFLKEVMINARELENGTDINKIFKNSSDINEGN
ncbi:MAG: ABC transporter substrate-binding protein [Candidatus Improbicoccus pseudotrichonymphae]|uniref:ABC transporter substrate-binding protein n=1 Tax=Candidatus Improbicoccus pseudotrichonymphae TaxID=3033792 RepID=A0AA48KX91_9FIRM|nr:MAG: ABC transporter substrate-binding protein [Candidatus Improbicoccus pseudotrichonymphae]